jgi:hypothetical protein
MESKDSGRRRFLKQAAALAGVAAGAGAGAEWAAKGQSAGSSAKSELQPTMLTSTASTAEGSGGRLITSLTTLRFRIMPGSSHRPTSTSCNCTRRTSPKSMRRNIG